MSIEIPFALDKKLIRICRKIPENSELYLIVQRLNVNKIYLDNLIREFKTLCELEHDKKNSNNDLLLLEQYKLAILENFYHYLNDQYSQKKCEEKKQQSKIWLALKALFFMLIGLFGMSTSGVFDFLFIKSLLSIIPHITHPLVFIISGVCTILNAALYASFQIAILKNMLGINFANINHLSLHQKQIQMTKNMNTLLLDSTINNQMSPANYQGYSRMAIVANQNITHLKPKYAGSYQEKWYLKIPRYGILGFGALMTMAGGYFMGVSLVTGVLPMLVGTPPGWIIIGFSMVCMVALYFAMRNTALSGTTHSSAKQFNEIKEKLYKKFNVRNEMDFEYAYSNKPNKTQTYPSDITHQSQACLSAKPEIEEFTKKRRVFAPHTSWHQNDTPYKNDLKLFKPTRSVKAKNQSELHVKLSSSI